MDEIANHILLPWVAPGMAAHLPDNAVEQLSAAQRATADVKVEFSVNGAPVAKTARMYGPGDVAGIDPQQVVRVEPRDHTPDFEPNYFPLIEFDRPDFPWLFTPLKADAQARLRPWLCLVVVRRQPGVDLRASSSQPLPVLDIRAPAKPGDELPDLADAHLWAHAQVTGSARAAIKSTLESQPARNVSRLLCPRRLRPSTEYLACVVPAFEVGRRTGLSLPLDAVSTLTPAWTSGENAPSEVTLPVYYSWQFRTGIGGDFEELVRRLQPRELPLEVGKRPLDISAPGFAMLPEPPPGAPGTILGLEGALRVVGSHADSWPDQARLPFQASIARLLNLSWQQANTVAGGSDPIVGPPLYGCWHAAVHQVPQGGPVPPAWPPAFWLDDLNMDPRNRVAAAMGTRVVQDQQEQLMAAAWAQLGDIERINQRLRQAQLSRAMNARFHANVFDRLSDDAFFRIVAPAQSRLTIDDQGSPAVPAGKRLLVQRIARSFVPQAAVSAPLRKLTRPRGAVNRQFSKASQPGATTMFGFFNTNLGIMFHRPAPFVGEVTVNQVSQAALDALLNAPRPGFVWNPEPPPHWERQRAGYREMLDLLRLPNLTGAALASRPTPPNTPPGFREAAIAHHEMLTAFFTQPVQADIRSLLVTRDLKAAAMAALTPATAVSAATQASMSIGSPPLRTGDVLDPIMDAPVFPQPMYEALRDVSQDALFPGLEHVPPNTVQLLQTNARFIESYMVGLNAEMGRELLWRGYPTDQRGTYFQQFWDTSAAAGERPDIIPIHEWGTRALGTTAAGATGDTLVLLIRGELLRRYPGTIIYATRAVSQDGRRQPSANAADEAHPVFRGSLDPDVNFVGFDLTADDVLKDDGYFIVFQQQPTEPRFGLDDDPFGEGESGIVPALKGWNDLNWAHVAPDPAALAKLSHVPVREVSLAPTDPHKGIWGRNAAHMAYITKQRLVRVAIHATEMLP